MRGKDRGGTDCGDAIGVCGRKVGERSSLHMSLSTQHSIATVSVVLLQKVGFQVVNTQPKSVLMEPSSRTDLLV